MNKCRLCQKVNNNLMHIYSNRIKSLAQIILKLKGFEDSFDVNNILKICGKCRHGIENVSTFWENIPEAAPILEELHDEEGEGNTELLGATKPSFPAITLTTSQEQKGYDDFRAAGEHNKLEPIKIRIKLPNTRKRQDNSTASMCSSTKLLPKRIRRCPKRYQDWVEASTHKILAIDENSKTDSNKYSDTSLNNLPVVALLRLSDGLEIGKLVEIYSKGSCSRIRIICLICFQVFCFENRFKKHLKMHTKYECKASEDEEDTMKKYSYYCTICNKSFQAHDAVRRHFRTAHSEDRPLKCQYCAASFKYHFNLDYHMAKHVPQKGFECEFCKKNFLKRYELKIHLRTHTKERPYKCEFCSYASAHRSNLKTHRKTKHLNEARNSQDLNEGINVVESPAQLFIPPLALVQDEVEIPPTLNHENQSNSTSTTTYPADYTTDLCQENVEDNISETEVFVEHDDDGRVTQPNDNNNIAETTYLNESCKENFISQAMLGTLKLDYSILKTLPSSTLLDLKKWPKSFQSIPSPQIKELERPPEPIKSMVKYTPLARYSNENSIKIRNYYNMMDNVPSTSNRKTSNVDEVSIASVPKTNDEIIKITKLAESPTPLQQQHENLNAVLQTEIVNNELKPTEIINSDMHIKNVSLELINDAQSWEVLKFSAKTGKIENISNTPSCESNNVLEISNEKPLTEQSLTTFFDTNTTTSSTPLLKYTNISQRSLLKNNLKTSQPQTFNLSLSKSNETPITLASNKSLITKIEILPPLNTLDILHQKSSSATASPNLIKPPIDYKHQCHYCYKYFKLKSALNRHIRTHTGEKPYKCNLCSKSYADASNYRKHKTLHKTTAEILNIAGSSPYAVQNSPAYSTVSDPDPDGIEIMQTLKRFECSATEDDDNDEDNDDASTTSSTLESDMWQNVLEHALNNNEWRENLKRNLTAINNAILPA